MSAVNADRFVEFYRALSVAIAQLSQSNGADGEQIPPKPKDPFPWQTRIAKRVSDPANDWPDAIALPTAAGKTACIEIAIFAMAAQASLGNSRTAPRRIFFVVDRRIVVDQAYEHAKNIAKVLNASHDGILGNVARMLRELAGDPNARPLDVFALRGGMYRETAWIRSPLQPMVIASTVDQVGSRLLFRGYGVSDSMRPVHAGLVGNDALILLDEAHCAKPFQQTISYVQKYREWGEADARPPFRFVSITATPNQTGDIVRDEADDHAHPVLGPRIIASKPTALLIADRAKGKAWKNWGPPLVEKLAEQAQGLLGIELGQMSNGQLCSVRAVGVIVNRVATARELSKKLTVLSQNRDGTTSFDVILLTGRMRPVDRDEVLKQLAPLFSGAKESLEKPIIVVATQCLEVGADLDFHALVTECASLDALRQRFGRLNRVAARPTAKAVVVVRTDQTEESSTDPVYGSSLAETWKWLKANATQDVFDFGVAAIRGCLEGVDVAPLNAPSLDAPVLFPAHLDCWVQTHPIPVPDPEPSLFLHGTRTGLPDVQVVIRDDLGDDDRLWSAIVSLRPPTSAEAVPVRIDVFRDWLAETGRIDDSSDIEGDIATVEEIPEARVRRALRWSGSQSEVIVDPRDVRPGNTFVISNVQQDLDLLGDFPRNVDGLIDDCGDLAFQRSRDRAILRLPEFLSAAEREQLNDEEFEVQLTNAIEGCLTVTSPEWIKRAVTNLREPRNRSCIPHPLKGWIVIGKRRLHQFDPGFLDDAESSKSPSRPVTLEDHSRGVASVAERFAVGCGLEADLYRSAGFFHDLGKLDPRFQAMLKGCTPLIAAGTPLAKSAKYGSADRSIHQYPAGARHELLSAALVATKTDDDLLLHLIATHHGAARPFAAGVEENSAAKKPFTAWLLGEAFSLETSAQDVVGWNADLPERFWRVVRKYGWWGAAFREAIFRLADHEQSRREQEPGSSEPSVAAIYHLRTREEPKKQRAQIELRGIDGSQLLGFLAALGTLRMATLMQPSSVLPLRPRLSWGTPHSMTTPIIQLPWECDRQDFAVQLAESLRLSSSRTEFSFAVDLSVAHEVFREFSIQVADASTEVDRAGVDFAAAFGSDAQWKDAVTISDTAFRTMAGAGHQHFLGFMSNILRTVEAAHVSKSLYSDWRYDDPVEKLTMRWDPIDDVRYALRWRNPSGDPIRRSQGSVLGANALAIMALPLFPTVPQSDGLETTAFRGRRASSTFVAWPLWSQSLTIDSVRSFLAMDCGKLSLLERTAAGINRCFRAQRLTIGKVRNFSPASALPAE